MFGGENRIARYSPWIDFVKEFAQENDLPYEEALKKAGPAYRQIKSRM